MFCCPEPRLLADACVLAQRLENVFTRKKQKTLEKSRIPRFS